MPGLRKRNLHMPTAAFEGLSAQGSDRRKRHQVAGGVIEDLHRQRFWLDGVRSFCFSDIESGCGLHE